jgi:hypothetical protein
MYIEFEPLFLKHVASWSATFLYICDWLTEVKKFPRPLQSQFRKTEPMPIYDRFALDVYVDTPLCLHRACVLCVCTCRGKIL